MNKSDQAIFIDLRRKQPQRTAVFATAAAFLLIAVVFPLLFCRLYLPAAGLLGVAVLVALWKAVVFTTEHREWVVLPIWMTFAIISVSFFDDAVRAPIHYGLLTIFCVPLLPAAFRSGLIRRGGYRLYIYYIGFAAFSVCYSIAPAYSLARLYESAVVILALIAVASEVNGKDDIDRILAHLFLGCTIITALMMVSLVLPHSLSWVSPEASLEPSVIKQMHSMGVSVDGIERFQSIFSGPNDVGALMLVTIGVGLTRWDRVKSSEKALIAVVIACAALCGALADSRSPFVALAIGTALFVVWRHGLRGLLAMGALVTATCALLVATGHDFSAYTSRGDITTLTGRTEMWAFVVKQIASHPILGFGYEVGGAIFDNPYFPLWWGPWDQGPHVSVHNGYLSHAIGVGIPVTLFWLYIMLAPWVFTFSRSEDRWQIKRLFFFLLVPILVHNMSEVMADDAIGIVGFFFGLLWVLGERYRLVIASNERAAAARHRATMPRAVAVFVPSE